jgi:GAF domain-containing protein
MSPEWSSLILAHDEERRTELETGGRVFPSGQLIPGGVSGGKRRRAVVVKSLYFRDNQLGFVVFEMGPREGTVYEVLRGQISSALHAARLVQQVESRALQLQTAAEVSRAASTILDPNELSRQVVNLIHERFDLYYAGLFLVDEVSIRGEPGSKWAVLRAGTGEAGQKMLEQGYRLEVGGESMIGWCIASKQTRVALDVGEEAIRFNNPLLPETRSELALPLVSRGEAIGALTIQSAKEAAFGEEDITILETLADQVANAIANIRLFERTQATLREMEAVHQRYLQQAWSEYLRSAGVTSYETGHPGVSPLGDALLPEVQQAMERRNALIVDGDGSGHSALVVPIALRGAIIGVLGIHDDEGGRRWTEDEISLVEEVVARMAQAAESIRLLDDTQHRVAREQVIGGVTAHLRETLDVDTVLQTAVREIRKALGLHDVTIQLGMDVDQAV